MCHGTMLISKKCLFQFAFKILSSIPDEIDTWYYRKMAKNWFHFSVCHNMPFIQTVFALWQIGIVVLVIPLPSLSSGYCTFSYLYPPQNGVCYTPCKTELIIPPRKMEFKRGILFSACSKFRNSEIPSFRQQRRSLYYNFSAFCPIL